MKNLISIHFDGPIAAKHAVQLRTFSKTLGHVQTAIDRAYLDIKYGNVWKNARLKDEDYTHTDFLLQQTREGGFIADLLGDKDSGDVVTRIYNAVLPAYEQAQAVVVPDQPKLVDLAEQRSRHYKSGAQEPIPYAELIDNPDPGQTRAYGDRSIVKEFDQIASAIRARDGDGSVVEVDLYAGKAFPKFVFNSDISAKFHNVVSIRALGDPVQLSITLRGLDSGNGGTSKAKAMNLLSKKEFNLHIHTDRGFGSLRKYLKKRNPPPFTIVACPVLEYGAFDPLAGDMYFIAIVADEKNSVPEVEE
ncbi:hypothetical protein ACO0LO_19725 [Undibacterium sp. TJN25]|uniref:hypothetical protein n=1 Tax=Undibacterium sp. TJN25 TaxID=3413056 RepID=UPI003BF264F2